MEQAYIPTRLTATDVAQEVAIQLTPAIVVFLYIAMVF